MDYEILAKTQEKAEMLIYDVIGGNSSTSVSSKKFNDDLKSLGDIKTLKVRISSKGGNVFEGIAIHNTLKNHPAKIEVQIDSIAASIASIIALAGDEISMSSNAFFMIHDPFAVVMGNSDDLRSAAANMDKIRQSMLKTYSKRVGEEKETQISDMMKAETWFSAEEALDFGFIDKITEEMKMAACGDLSGFKNVPAELLTMQAVTTQPKPSEQRSNNMLDLQKLKAEHPDLFKEVFGLGAKSVTLESFAEETKAIEQKGFDAGKEEGVKAERSRCVELMNAGGEPQATKEAIEQGTELQAAYKSFFEAQKKAMAEQAEKIEKEKPGSEREAELAAVAAAHGSPATAAGVEKAKEGEKLDFMAKVNEHMEKTNCSKGQAVIQMQKRYPKEHAAWKAGLRDGGE